MRDELSEYVEGALSETRRAAVERHLAACPACRAEAEASRQAEEALRSLAVVVPAPDLTADLRRRLSAVGSRSRPLRWLWAGAAVAAVAAAALLALRAPAPPAPPPALAREPATAESHPRQLAARPVTEEDGVRRPTAPPAPSPARPHRALASADRLRRVQHDAPSAAATPDTEEAPPLHERGGLSRAQSREGQGGMGGSAAPAAAVGGGPPSPASSSLPARDAEDAGDRQPQSLVLDSRPSADAVPTPRLPEVLHSSPAVGERSRIDSSMAGPPSAAAMAVGNADLATPRPEGVVLLVAAPEPPRPSSSYYGQVTLPDGAVSTYQETVERNAAGEPQSVKIAYQQTPPQAGAGNGG